MTYEHAMSVACLAMGVIALIALWERVALDAEIGGGER